MKLLKPRELADFLADALSDGRYKLTYEEIAYGLWTKRTLIPEKIEAIRAVWHRAEKRLRDDDICAMLVTREYFTDYPHTEPKNQGVLVACIALHWRRSAGIRLLTAKGAKNDPMAIIYFRLRCINLKGTIAALEDRISVEYKKGNLTKRVGRREVERATAPVLPMHQMEFAELMDLR